jgi:hypothetical protein
MRLSRVKKIRRGVVIPLAALVLIPLLGMMGGTELGSDQTAPPLGDGPWTSAGELFATGCEPKLHV